MKLVKSLLLGTAAGISAVAGAQAADLPVRKAAPVEYVRVCSAHGVGFFYIPGTETCLRVSGRARFEYQAVSVRQSNNSNTGFRTIGRLNLDARTSTAYGTLRTFVRLEAARRTGHHFSGTAQRRGESEIGSGIDFFNQAHTLVTLDKAFIQFAGMTAGRATSFFDFFGNDHVMFGIPGSARDSTNLLAYTASFGSGWSATLSMEDPVERRYPLVGLAGTAGSNFIGFPGAVATLGAPGTTFPSSVAPLPVFDPITGNVIGYFGQQQVNSAPDVVGAIRVDQAWGSAQLSGAIHQVKVGGFAQPSLANGNVAVSTAGLPVLAGGFAGGFRPDTEYGYAIQGGVKINLPMIAPGDNLYLQAAYGKGALDYTVSGTWAFGSATGSSGSATGLNASFNRFPLTLADGIIDPFRGEVRLSNSWSAIASFLHYWTPQVRQAIFAGYAKIDYPSIGGAFPAGSPAAVALGAPGTVASPAGTGVFATQNTGFLRDFSFFTVGTNVIWSPVRDLDLGVEVMYDSTLR